MNDIHELEDINLLYRKNLNIDFPPYDHSALCAIQLTHMDILDSQTAMNTPLPASPPDRRVLNHSNPTPSPNFKPPKLVTANWIGQTYDFYPWLSSILHGFTLTRCDDSMKLVLTLMPSPWIRRDPSTTSTGTTSKSS